MRWNVYMFAQKQLKFVHVQLYQVYIYCVVAAFQTPLTLNLKAKGSHSEVCLKTATGKSNKWSIGTQMHTFSLTHTACVICTRYEILFRNLLRADNFI